MSLHLRVCISFFKVSKPEWVNDAWGTRENQHFPNIFFKYHCIYNRGSSKFGGSSEKFSRVWENSLYFSNYLFSLKSFKRFIGNFSDDVYLDPLKYFAGFIWECPAMFWDLVIIVNNSRGVFSELFGTQISNFLLKIFR